MKNNKGFTLIELLAVIVILAILMVAGGAAVMSTMNNAKVNTFKNEALAAINSSTNMYTEISMNAADSREYLTNSDTSNYKAMCVTLQGMVLNGYYDKALEENTIRGLVLVEVPFNGGNTKYTIWMSDDTYGIQGYEKAKISGIKFGDDNNKQIQHKSDATKVGAYYNAQKGVVTNLNGIDKLLNAAYYGVTNTNKFKGGDATKDMIIAKLRTYGTDYDGAAKNEMGTTGESYTDIRCINMRLDDASGAPDSTKKYTVPEKS